MCPEGRDNDYAGAGSDEFAKSFGKRKIPADQETDWTERSGDSGMWGAH